MFDPVCRAHLLLFHGVRKCGIWRKCTGRRVPVSQIDIGHSSTGVYVDVYQAVVFTGSGWHTRHIVCLTACHVLVMMVCNDHVITRGQSFDLIILLILERIHPEVGSLGQVESHHAQWRDDFTGIVKST